MSLTAGISRRQLLGGALAGGAVLAAPGAVLAVARGSSPGSLPANRLVRSLFEPLVGATFVMRESGHVTRVVLHSIHNLAPLDPTLIEQQFSLTFVGAAGSPGHDGIRLFQHDKLGGVHLFVTAAGQASGLVTYQAVVNRR